MRSPRTEELALFTAEAPLPKSGAAPEWITIFPKIGPIQTRDQRNFVVDADTIMSALTSIMRRTPP